MHFKTYSQAKDIKNQKERIYDNSYFMLEHKKKQNLL